MTVSQQRPRGAHRIAFVRYRRRPHLAWSPGRPGRALGPARWLESPLLLALAVLTAAGLASGGALGLLMLLA